MSVRKLRDTRFGAILYRSMTASGFPQSRAGKVILRWYGELRFVHRLFRRRHLFRFFGDQSRSMPESGPRIVLNLAANYEYRNLLFLSFLAVKLAIKGGRPYVLVDDNVLEQHDLGHYSGRSTKNSFRDWYTRQFLKHISFYRGYSEFITDEERERVDRDAVSLFKSQDFTINGINLWPAVESSLVRYYLSSAGLVQDEPDYEEMALSFIRNALLSYRIAINVRKKLKPDALVMYHGIYSTWAPFAEYYKQRNVPVVIYGLWGFRGNNVRYVSSQTDLLFNACKDQIDVLDAAKSASELMDARFAFRSRDLTRYGKYGHDPHVIERLKVHQADRKAFALFTNVLWDTSLADGHTIFRTPLEWIRETIEYFLDHPELVLLIRAHPAETSTMKPRVSVKDIVSRELGTKLSDNELTFVENIGFIPSALKLKSYSLFDIIDAGIVYNGTLGLEMMYAGLPVLVAGQAPYLNTSFVTRFTRKEEYFQSVEGLEGIVARQEAHRAELLQFIHYYFDLLEMPLRHLGTKRDLIDPPDVILQEPAFERLASDIMEKAGGMKLLLANA